MAGYLIVDGYNIIQSWPGLKDLAGENLEASRGKLIDYLSGFVLSWDKITVVFDAHQVVGSRTPQVISSIEVVYTREGETADSYIEKLTHKLKEVNGVNVLVATSDLVEQQVVFSHGAQRISALGLRALLESTAEQVRINYTENISTLIPRNPLDNLLQPEIKDKLENIRCNRVLETCGAGLPGKKVPRKKKKG